MACEADGHCRVVKQELPKNGTVCIMIVPVLLNELMASLTTPDQKVTTHRQHTTKKICLFSVDSGLMANAAAEQWDMMELLSFHVIALDYSLLYGYLAGSAEFCMYLG
jgi:hypothetical protein